jgi:hypothetical protein
MSTAILVAVAVVAVALALWQRLRVRTALSFQHLVGTGHAFLLLGALAGLLFEPARADAIVSDMSPLLALAAGWVGFASGMRFELAVLAPVPRRAFVVALVPAVVAAVLVGGSAAAVLLSAGVGTIQALAIAATLGAAAANSGPTLAALLRSRRGGRAATSRPTLRMIELSAGFDDALVIVLALVTFAVLRPTAEPIGAVLLLLFATGGGVLLGLVTWALLGGRADDDERLLLGLGILVFTAGFAGWLLLPPATVTAIAAFVLINLPGARMQLLLRAVRRLERPAVVLLMLMIGFLCAGPLHWVAAPLFGAMTGVRLAGKWWGGELASGTIAGARGLEPTPGWGQGLASQGNLGLIVALSLMSVWGDEIARSALFAAAAASVVNELIAPALLVRVVRGRASTQTDVVADPTGEDGA